MFSLISANKKNIKCLSITILFLIIIIIILLVCLCLCKSKNDAIIKEPLVKQKYKELFASSGMTDRTTSSPDTITITQSGGFQWTMESDTDGVVDRNEEHFPTLTIKKGAVVNFVGKVEKSHSFSVKTKDNVVVVGPSELADSAAGVEYDFTWTASNTGTFEYFCEPHESFMKGNIIVV